MNSSEMALSVSQSTLFTSLHFPLHKHHFIGTTQNQRTLNFPRTETHRYPLISLFYLAGSKPCSPLRRISSAMGDDSGDGTRESSVSTSISSVFVKGFPDSVSEGRLKRVFSEIGEVSNVKIIINERTRQSLGYGYVWFTNKEHAQLAVEVMNGKFFDGRFILVKLGKPGLSSGRRRSHSDLHFLQTEECVKAGTDKEIARLPWRGGSLSNPNYELLRAELRKMAPPNGRALLLFKSKCGCPIDKLEGWGPKLGKRHKKSPANLPLKGGVDNR